MMASDLVLYLGRVPLTLEPLEGGRIKCRGKKGALTLVLTGLVKDFRQPLWQLLTTGEDSEMPKGFFLPATDYSVFRTWRTGTVPANARLMYEPLPVPTCHCTPSAVQTFLGKPCSKKKCKLTETFKDGTPASRYFQHSRVCVACWERLDKRTTDAEEE
jgi:hypothetical protein